jgi:hypothetical protein
MGTRRLSSQASQVGRQATAMQSVVPLSTLSIVVNLSPLFNHHFAASLQAFIYLLPERWPLRRNAAGTS